MDYNCYEWFKKWFKLIINDNEQGCIICGENKYLTSRIETSICSDVINIYLYKDSRNLKANMYWEMNGSDRSSYYEVRKQAEQFLKREIK